MEQSIIKSISEVSFQDFLFANENLDEVKLVLKHKNLFDIPSGIIANQIIGRRKAKAKLPTWHKTKGIVYPPSLNLEQCSSEPTAKLKAAIIKAHAQKEGLTGADLTGGFGIDSFFLSEICSAFYYVEKEDAIFRLAKHNHEILQAKNIEHYQTTAEGFVNSNKNHFDFIFIDPSRRIKQTKVFKLSDCEPSIERLLSKLVEHASFILIKASPLLDLQQGMRELKSVKSIYVVSVDNECKEILFLLEKDFVGKPLIHCVNLADNQTDLKFTFNDERNSPVQYSEPLNYLYEPNASILKAGAFKLVGNQFNLFKLHVNTHLYTSLDFIENFPGRVFKIEMVNPKEHDLKRLLLDGKANVVTRNYPLSSAELKKKLKLKDGGDMFLFGTISSTKLLIVASRESSSQIP